MLDIDCAAGGGIPAQAVRLGIALDLSIDSITSSQSKFQEFKDEFLVDLSTALAVEKKYIVFVDVSTPQASSSSRRLTSSSPGVVVTFDLLPTPTKAASELKTTLVAMVKDTSSALYSGNITKSVDSSKDVVQVTEDGEKVSASPTTPSPTTPSPTTASPAGPTTSAPGDGTQMSAAGPRCRGSVAAVPGLLAGLGALLRLRL